MRSSARGPDGRPFKLVLPETGVTGRCPRCRGETQYRTSDGAQWCSACEEVYYPNFARFLKNLDVGSKT